MVHNFLVFIFGVYMCTHSFIKLHVYTHTHKVKWVKQNVGKHQMNGIHYSHLTHHNILESLYRSMVTIS